MLKTLTIIAGITQTTAMSFGEYTKLHNRNYPTSDVSMRKKLYEQRVQVIEAHNSNKDNLYTTAINAFTDRTEEELQSIKGLDRNMQREQMSLRTNRPQRSLSSLDGIPASLDWRDENVITPVKNQGHCGSCWSFASTETIESHWAIKTGKLQELSEQFILDCTPNPNSCGGTGGCGGGTAELAYDRLKELGGIPSEWEYPYVSILGNASKCHGLPLAKEAAHSGAVAAAANVTGYFHTTPNSYTDLISALQTGPLAISVDASSWHNYAGGIYDGGNHTNPELDHLVQLVGYGTDSNSNDYWIVRNSWTPQWGINGYILLKRSDPTKGPAASCGIDINPLDGNGCTGGPPKVKVCGQSGVLYDGVYPLID